MYFQTISTTNLESHILNEHETQQSLGLIVNEILLNGDSCNWDKEITNNTS